MKSLNKQEGGDHYKDHAIQPVEFIQKNKIGFMEGNVIKYVCRHHKKNGVEDINKAIHYLEMLRELQYPEKSDENQMEMDLQPNPIEIAVEDLQVGDTYRHTELGLNYNVKFVVNNQYNTVVYTKCGWETYVRGTKLLLHERKELREEPEQSR